MLRGILISGRVDTFTNRFQIGNMKRVESVPEVGDRFDKVRPRGVDGRWWSVVVGGEGSHMLVNTN